MLGANGLRIGALGVSMRTVTSMPAPAQAPDLPEAPAAVRTPPQTEVRKVVLTA